MYATSQRFFREHAAETDSRCAIDLFCCLKAGACFSLAVYSAFSSLLIRTFTLNKDKRMGVMESLESFFRGRNDHGNLLQSDVDVSRFLFMHSRREGCGEISGYP